MRKKEPLERSEAAVGGASLLVIFSILCLTIFALLSLTSVRANERLSKKSAETVSSYYAADCEAQKTLSLIRAGEIPDGVIRDGDIYSYDCTISDAQAIKVEVVLHDGEYSIVRWETVPIGEWEPDDSYHVWDGESFE